MPFMTMLRCRVVIAWIVSGLCLSILAQSDRSQGRSQVISRYGIVASEHPLASQAGVTLLNRGGNAIDAAIAANAAMGVLAPMMCGLGGDLFALIYIAKENRVYGLNASGWSPAAMNRDRILATGRTNMPQSGIHSVSIPGAVEGWDALLHRFGRKNFAEVLAPASALARDGFPVSELVAQTWKAGEPLLRQETNASRTFLPGGRAPQAGEIFRNPGLVWSYAQLAREGKRAFYQGAIAQRLLACSQRLGGQWSREDLADYRSEWVVPISTSYREWTVYEIPPNGQGLAALIMLNLMENFRLHDYGPGSANALHIMIEAKKLAYADLLHYVGDPRFSSVPVSGLLGKYYASERAKLINLAVATDHALPGRPLPMGNDTTYLCVVDRQGNMVSLIQSDYFSFGSGIVPEGTGFVLQNRAALFSLEPALPNTVAGHKRPLHTIIPALMTKGQLGIAFGIMGGWNQAQAHAQFVSNIADHHLNLQEAIEAARFTKLNFEGRDVQVESRISLATRNSLQARGHQILLRGEFSPVVGGGQAVMRDFAAGVNYGASDPRKDGAAIPELRVP